jgi:hypothetical protein
MLALLFLINYHDTQWVPKWGIKPSIIIILILKGEKLVTFDAVQWPQARALSALGPLISGMP